MRVPRNRSAYADGNCVQALERRLQFAVLTLDAGFSDDGKLITDIGNKDNYAFDVAIQKDGKIVVVGRQDSGGVAYNDFLVVRYNSDGSLDDGGPLDSTPDDSFGARGSVITNLSGVAPGDFARAVAIQPDGKIVVGGQTNRRRPDKSTDADFAILRYNPDGSLDNTFEGDGIQIDNIQSTATTWSADRINDLVIQSDGKIVAVGYSDEKWAVARYTSAGVPDVTFSTDGFLTENFSGIPGANNGATGVELDNLGRIVVGGDAALGGKSQLGFARYLNDGTLDSTFDADGKLTSTSNFSKRMGDVGLTSSGRILGFGEQESGATSYSIYYNYSQTGTDEIPAGATPTRFKSVARTLTERFIAVGTAEQTTVAPYTAIVPDFIIRDIGFYGYTGDFLRLDFGGSDSGQAVAIGPDGSIVVVGTTTAGGSGSNLALAKFEGYDPAAYGTVTGQVFKDTDGDGVRDVGEKGHANVRVYIPALPGQPYNGESDRSVLTDSKGNYTLSGLTPGVYSLNEIVPAKYTRTSPPGDAVYSLAVTARKTLTGRNFGNAPKPALVTTTRISGSVFNDLDGDGKRDIGKPIEPDLEGWTVFLDLNRNGKRDTGEPKTLTDSSGNWLFDNLNPGKYRVREILQATWRRTTKSFVDISILSGTQMTGIKFGNTQLGQIAGIVFNDLNRDKKMQPGESPLSDWLVYLDFDNDAVYDMTDRSAVSDSTGYFGFNDLKPGSYVVRIESRKRWTRTLPTGSAYAINISGADSFTDALFGLKKIAV